MYYFTIKDENIINAGEVKSLNFQCIEVSKEQYNLAALKGNNYFLYRNGELILNPNYEEEEAQKEAERIAQLHLTRGDVFRGLLLARQVTRQQIRALIEAMPDDTPEQAIAKEYALIDFDESLDFYRGVALIDTLGQQLGISSEAMTQFFETNDWHYLVPDTRVQGE